ncbi:Rdx family protein [Ammoniphilus oxalaticus]|uniref:Rdx family protein n=1 Tax=Ammoniphilus oxalaticus TaxID=66863 RepID=UPI0024828629|nr:Rdx family protein [Ammoniphilus oxalaticus]
MPKAISLVEELMSDDNFRNDVEDVALLPKGGGIFEITVNDRLVYSKKELDRFPEENEVVGLIRELILN